MDFDLLTSDRLKIKATFYEAPDSKKGVILLHMLRRNRSNYKDLAELLVKNGFNVLTVDFRGHGESEGRSGEAISWEKFTDEDFSKMVLDVESAYSFLKQQGMQWIGMIGASIGANIALIAASKLEVGAVVMLSPGLDYHRINPLAAVKIYKNPLFIVASEGDDQYSFDSAAKIFESSVSVNKKFLKFKDVGHGTDMFKATDIAKEDGEIIKFLKEASQ